MARKTKKAVETESRRALLDVAEHLFMSRGFTGVKLRDIAAEIGIKHASLYHHVPGGKEALYVAVIERNLYRHQAGLKAALVEAGSALRDQLHAVARWFMSQPPLDLGRMARSDLPSLGSTHANRLNALLLNTLREPIATTLRAAIERGEVEIENTDFAAFGLVALLQSVHNIPEQYVQQPDGRVQLAIASADMLLDGLLRRNHQ